MIRGEVRQATSSASIGDAATVTDTSGAMRRAMSTSASGSVDRLLEGAGDDHRAHSRDELAEHAFDVLVAHAGED